MTPKSASKRKSDAARKRAMRAMRPTMSQVVLELERGSFRPLRQNVREVVQRQRDLESLVLQNWNDNQAALIDLLHRIMTLEKR